MAYTPIVPLNERLPGVQYDEYGRPMSSSLDFREPMDYVHYIDNIVRQGGKPGQASIDQANEIRSNPGGWEVKGPGLVSKKDDWLARNLPWIGPTAVTAGIFATNPGTVTGLFGGGGTTAPAATTAPTATATTGATTVASKAALGTRITEGLKKGLKGMNLLDYIMAGMAAKDLVGGGDEEGDRFSFIDEKRGNLSLDPRDVLGYGITGASRFGETLSNRLAQDITLPGAYAQQPPVFVGGGLPMPIGVTGVDPALSNPGAYLRKPGIASNDPFQGLGGLMSGPAPQGPTTDAEEANAALQLLMPDGVWKPRA